MDPEATVELINDAIFTGDLCAAYDHVSDLDRWIAKSGMIPWSGLNINRDLVRILKRGILQCSNEGHCTCGHEKLQGEF